MSKLLEIDKCSVKTLYSAVDVWIKKPHVVNKRLAGATQSSFGAVSDTPELHQLLSSLLKTDVENSGIFQFIHASDGKREDDALGLWSVAVRTIIPKVTQTAERKFKEVIIKELRLYLMKRMALEKTVSLHALSPEQWFSDGVAYPKLSWLYSELLPKLSRWALEDKASDFKSTLSLIPVEKYSLLYQQLKEKYRHLVKVWPEVTDPEKFVFEDVAIATYLLVLWAEERIENGTNVKQSFVDLGCGNGLLVHILNNEGHPGKGIDIRRRRIWDLYGPATNLEESAITPNNGFLFPTTDWLIGNHSDELTPWIPVIAARQIFFLLSFFVLPCCFFDFCGKYQRRQCLKSQYKEYIDFITEISSVCGFHTEEDCLRIPSTKRVCLIGKTRRYKQNEEALVEEQRSNYIRGREGLFSSSRTCTSAEKLDQDGSVFHNCEQNPSSAAKDWVNGFHPREKTESVRNCVSLPRDLVEAVVFKVAMTLLNTENSQCDDTWNKGGSMMIGDVASLLDQPTLQALKNECGGLQTLLRNNHQVFRVEGGWVFIRDWRTNAPGQSSRGTSKCKPPPLGALKTRLCWFHTHHPNGCPLPSQECAFAHGETELRPSTKPRKKLEHDQHNVSH
ncbi:hypothetical protein DNTS_001089 [Danionella cerebrum]|uniref:tRNA (uracil-O(2)-)-methyltransferase n=1 Tax=Danionella cerebrum TaxID=2873325 RepID=A0A553RFE0_9TELE|nr:hypothetical protein DNTS_001089 [Danionella translucida]